MDGIIEEGDEVRKIGDVVVSHMELDEITRLILGRPGSQVSVTLLREDRDKDGEIVDDVGWEYTRLIERRAAKSAGIMGVNAAMRGPKIPVEQLEDAKRASIGSGNGDERAVWTKAGIMRGSSFRGSFKGADGVM